LDAVGEDLSDVKATRKMGMGLSVRDVTIEDTLLSPGMCVEYYHKKAVQLGNVEQIRMRAREEGSPSVSILLRDRTGVRVHVAIEQVHLACDDQEIHVRVYSSGVIGRRNTFADNICVGYGLA
jgi:hypothetical protein